MAQKNEAVSALGQHLTNLPSAVQPEKIYQFDPLARLLLDTRIRLTPVVVGALVLLYELFLNVGLAYRYKVLTGGPGLIQQPFFGSWVDPVFHFVVYPATWMTYLWISQAPATLFRKIGEAGLIPAEPVDYHQFEQNKLLPNLRWWGWPLLSGAIVVALTSLPIAHMLATGVAPCFRWNCAYPLGWQLLSTFTTWVTWYVVCMIVAREVVTVWNLTDLFRTYKQIRLYPLHPDKCGGLRPISDYALRFMGFLAAAGLGLAMMAYDRAQTNTFSWSSEYVLGIGAIAYAVFAPILFFLTFGSAHVAMGKTKEEWITKISARFQQEYGALQNALDGPNLKESVEKVEQLQKVYELTERFPVWPFDAGTLRWFLATFGSPLLGPLIALAIDYLRQQVHL